MRKFGQLTADLIPGVIGQKVQAGAEEDYQHHDSIPEEVLELLKPNAVCVSLSEKSWLDMDCWTSQRINAKSKPDIHDQWVDWITLLKTGISVSALRWLRCLLTRCQPVLTTTQWSIYVCLKNWHCESCHFTAQYLKQNDANRRKNPQMARQEEESAEKEEEGYEKKPGKKEGVSYEPIGFSTRFVFFLVYFIAHLSCLKFYFFSSCPAQKTPYLSFLTWPPTCMHF